MKINKTLYVTNRNDWRTWLEKNHDTEKEIWLIYYKKHREKPSIPYADSVEEALCFGWIDSIIKRIDDEKFLRKFTPRKDKSKWSELNKKRARKMIKEGKMTEVGLTKIDQKILDEKEGNPVQKKEFVIPPEIEKKIRKNEKAWKNFNDLAPCYKRQYIGWVASTKKEQTRERRLKELISVLEEGKKLGMK